MGIICSHPTVTLNYRFNGVDANTLYWEIYEASKAHHFRLESHDDQRYHLELEFVSPLCQFSDILSIQVQSVGGGGAEAVCTSRCTNCCPGWCCGCCKCLFQCWTCYNDGNDNQQHIRELMKAIRRPHVATIVGTDGIACALSRMLD